MVNTQRETVLALPVLRMRPLAQSSRQSQGSLGCVVCSDVCRAWLRNDIVTRAYTAAPKPPNTRAATSIMSALVVWLSSKLTTAPYRSPIAIRQKTSTNP